MQTPSIPPSFVTLFISALHLYRQHFLSLALRVIPTFVSATVLYHIISLFIISGWIVLVIASLTFGATTTMVVQYLSTRQSGVRSIAAHAFVFRAHTLRTLFILFMFQALLVAFPGIVWSLMAAQLWEWHKYDYVPPNLGSGDTPYEEALFWLGLPFLCIYPLVIIGIVGWYRLLVPTVLFEGGGAVQGLYRSIQHAHTQRRQILMTTIVVAIVYGSMVMAVQFGWRIVFGSSVPALPSVQSLLYELLLAIGCALVLPIPATMSVVLYDTMTAD